MFVRFFVCLRMYLMDKFGVQPDPWDNRIIVSWLVGVKQIVR